MKAVFPGSFDPITNGHLDIIKRATKIFDQVIIVISNNTHKVNLFTPQERYSLVKEVCPYISVKLIQDNLTIDFVRKLGARIIIRGARNEQDFVYEQQIALMNQKMNPEIETIILFSSPDYSFISSTLIREIAQFKGDLTQVVPENVNKALKTKINCKDFL